MKKKVFKKNGDFLGTAISLAVSGEQVEIEFPGDFPGMERKKIIFSGKILFEDENRIYIEYR